MGVIAGALGFILLFTCIILYVSHQNKVKARNAAIAEAAEKERKLEARRQQRLSDAKKYAQTKKMEDEESYQKMVTKFEEIIKVYPGTKYVQLAKDEIKKLKDRKEEKKKQAIEGLRKEAAPYIKKEDFSSALVIYKNYPCDFQDETQQERQKLINELNNIKLKAAQDKQEAARLAKQRAAENARRKEQALYNQITSLVYKNKYEDAQKYLEKNPKRHDYQPLLKTLTGMAALDSKVKKYLKKRIGKKRSFHGTQREKNQSQNKKIKWGYNPGLQNFRKSIQRYQIQYLRFKSKGHRTTGIKKGYSGKSNILGG